MKLSGIHFVDYIPRTAIGKPKRYLLKKMVIPRRIIPDSLTKQAKNSIDPSDIPSMVRNAVAKIAHVQPNEVKLSTKILQEFTIDSLSAIELALEIEQFSGVRVDGCMDKDMTVGKLIALVQNPNRIKPQNRNQCLSSDKKKIDYRIYCFYRKTS